MLYEIKKTFYKNGCIKTETDYCDGKINGFVRTYYEDGALESAEAYSNNIRNDDLVVYDRNGIITYSKDRTYLSCEELCHSLYKHL